MEVNYLWPNSEYGNIDKDLKVAHHNQTVMFIVLSPIYGRSKHHSAAVQNMVPSQEVLSLIHIRNYVKRYNRE